MSPMGVFRSICFVLGAALLVIRHFTPRDSTYETNELDRVKTRTALLVCALACIVLGVMTSWLWS